MDKQRYEGAKVLIIGVGAYGGGASTAIWMSGRGAKVHIVDTRDEQTLEHSLSLLKDHENIEVVLGPFQKDHFKGFDYVIPYPGMPYNDPHLQTAIENGAELVTETNVFIDAVNNPVIAVTGTRGKTTTTHWIAQLLSSADAEIIPSGNQPGHSLLSELEKQASQNVPMVVELSSWQLDYANRAHHAPTIAAITNIYPDHLNSYDSIEVYARAKSHIFSRQGADDYLILNYDNDWHSFFTDMNPRSSVMYVSQRPLPADVSGLFVSDDTLVFREHGIDSELCSIQTFRERRGNHNVDNLLIAVLATLLHDPTKTITEDSIHALGQVRYRQETIYTDNRLHIVNDTTATSPEALISSLERFASPTTYFIVGGTDKNLPFADCARVFKAVSRPHNVFFLNGSATDKLLADLDAVGFFDTTPPQTCGTLGECIQKIQVLLGKTKSTIVFSPGAASFEKFKNEFDRGEQFESATRTLLRL